MCGRECGEGNWMAKRCGICCQPVTTQVKKLPTKNTSSSTLFLCCLRGSFEPKKKKAQAIPQQKTEEDEEDEEEEAEGNTSPQTPWAGNDSGLQRQSRGDYHRRRR